MADPAQKLKDFSPEHDFFIGIDSDGCVFDSMEIKHKECFCPAFVYNYDLQPVSKYAREAWEFINLYSKSRGINRYHAVLQALDLLRNREEVKRRGVDIPMLQGLRDWTKRESKLGNPALKAEIERTGDPDLRRVWDWSVDVNDRVAHLVKNVPPFPLVRESLVRAGEKADLLVVSQTPLDALVREWQEHGIDSYVALIAGQEMGTKTEHITFAAGKKYPTERMLMIGDAPGDLKAARGNNALFFPVVPGREEESWERFHGEALDRFFAGTYRGAYEDSLLREFDASLPEKAPWQ